MRINYLQLKRALRTALIVLLLGMAGMTKGYALVTIGDLNYSLNTSTLTAIVTGHKNGTNATGSLTFPSSVTYTSQEYINGQYVNVTRTYSVTTIGGGAFYGCSSFTGSLTIPNSVTTIGSSAFSGCSGFTGSLTIPNSVTTIGSSAFSGCSGFTGSLTIPNSVTTIGGGAFYGCSGFTGSLTIPNSVTTIDGGAFYNCSGFTGSLTIPNSVTSISYDAFSGCSGFTGDLTIGYSVITIGNRAFENCSGFTGSLTIPNSVTTIGELAFSGCSGFNGNLTLGESVTTIGEQAFSCCSGFTGGLTIPNSVTTIGVAAFYNCSGFNGDLTIGNAVTDIGAISFLYCSGFNGNLTLGESVTTIGTNAFGLCSGFTGNLVIPNTVDTIGLGAFIYCSGFSDTLVIGTGVTYMDISAFHRCSGITEVQYNATNCIVAGDSEYPVFNELPNLNKIVIGENVETLPDYLFANCYSTLFIKSYAEVPPAAGGSNTFYGIDKEISVAVPCDTQEEYEEAAYWSEFTNFTESEHQFVVKVNPKYLGRAAIVQNATCDNSRVIVRATPNRGCRFVNWTCDGEEVSQIRSYVFDLEEDKVMVANFAPMRHFTGGGDTFVWSDPSNWEPEGVPTDTMAVEIQANAVIDTDVNIGSVYLHSNNVLTVSSGTVLTVNHTLESPDALKIIIEDGGQIAHHNEGAMATVKKTVEAYDATNESWNLISFPLADSGYVASVENMLSNDHDLYFYDEPTHYWMNQKDESSNFTELEAGKGYLYANSGFGIAYSFEDTDMDGWTTIDADGDGYNWEYSSSASAHNGSGYVKSASYINGIGALTPDNYLVSPQVGFTSMSKISFWACAQDANYAADHFGVALSITGNTDPDDFTTIEEWTMTAKSTKALGNWYQYTVNLGQFAGQTGYVALRHFNCQDMYYIIVDDVRFDGFVNEGIQNITLSFAGELENGSATINIPLSYTETAGSLKGFNLVGNPFAHNVSSYGSVNVAEGCYRMNDAKDDLIVSEISETDPLKPTEGFFVKATATEASITFNPQRGATMVKTGSIRVEVSKDNRIVDRLLVKDTEGQPLEKFSLNEKRTQVFAVQGQKDLAIVPCEGNEQPFSFKAAKDGQYTINVDADGMEFTYLHLIDNMTGSDVNLLVEPSYTFEAKTTDYASRFRLVFSANETDGPSTDSELFAFLNNSGSYNIFGIEGEATLQVVDVLGHILSSETFSGSYEKKLNVAPGVYLLRLINGDNVKVQKIIIK